MKYSSQEVIQFVQEEDVKFIRLAFCDVAGKPKNVSIMPTELRRAFEYGIAIDASAIDGFGDETHSDLFLRPDPDTLTVLPWRPEHGKVARMFCAITYPDGRAFEHDTRTLLKQAIAEAKARGYQFDVGPEMEFYLFRLDEDGNPTDQPYDEAGYMDMAPEDKCENVRREICLTLEQMGIQPESSHHEEGPGQNEIDFRYSDALTAADNTITFCTVVKTIAARNGLYADFRPKPLANKPGSGLHINLSIRDTKPETLDHMIAGILDRIAEMTVFLNPQPQSYQRLGRDKAPQYISWSTENRSQLIRIPAPTGPNRRAELRSPDPAANPYLAYLLLIYAGLDGIRRKLELPPASNENLFIADETALAGYRMLPRNLRDAAACAAGSSFIQECLPKSLIQHFCRG